MRLVLVHGGFHGAWCWAKLTPLLEQLGHEVIAIDLPGCASRHNEKASLASWRGALREVIDDGDILVGHSMGGFAISLGADEVPDKLAGLVYLSAAVPAQGKSMSEATDDTVGKDWPVVVGMPHESFMGFVETPSNGAGVQVTDKIAAIKLFLHDCTEEEQDWAWEHLTPLPIAQTLEPFVLSSFWTAPIPKHFIITVDDPSHPAALDRTFMRRLGICTAYAIDSSHSPYISRPTETAKILDVCSRGVRG